MSLVQVNFSKSIALPPNISLGKAFIHPNPLNPDGRLGFLAGPDLCPLLAVAMVKARCNIGTGESYDAYKAFCRRAKLRPLTARAFGDLISELDIYSLLRSRVVSRGRYGRTREMTLDLPQELVDKIYSGILLNFEMQN